MAAAPPPLLRARRAPSVPCAVLARLVCVFLLLAPHPAAAAPQRIGKDEEDTRPKVPAALQIEINRAIDRGVECLMEQQELDGSWRHDLAGYGAGATGLAVYTLMKCGVSPDHPAVVRGFEFITRRPATRTYSLATVMMAIAARGDTKDTRWMEELTERMLEWRQPRGWGYPDGRPDLSNTQFAGLALRAAASMGVRIKPKVWEDLGEIALEYLEDVKGSTYAPQGFRYEDGEPHPTGSMTAAGLSLVTIALDNLTGNRQAMALARQRSLAWLGKHLTVEYNPKPGSESGRHGWDLYYLYGLERVGSLLQVDKIGEHPWYELGARRLVGEQKERGDWGNQADTCFALLFLARATGSTKATISGALADGAKDRGLFGKDDPAEDVSLRASGRTELTIWISSFGDRVRRMYAPDEAGKEPLPIRRVEYLLASLDPPSEPLPIATVIADPAAPKPNARFPIQHTPLGPAEYDVLAEVTLVDFADGSEVVLRSKPMRVRVGLTHDPIFLEYATDPDRNELTRCTWQVSASSEANDHAAARAVDDLQATAWRPTPEDPTPWLRLEFERPPRANTLLLSPSFDPGARPGPSRPTRVRVIVNRDEKAPIEATLDPNPRRKTPIDLPKGIRIRTLEIQILSHTLGTPAAGLNELELQNRR
jgi:hypothetical protein